jgi:electron transport complex protein RnfG
MNSAVRLLVPVGALTAICAIAALALAAAHGATAPVIAEQERLFRLRSITRAIPSFDNRPDEDVVTLDRGGERVCVFRGRRGADVVGVAFEWVQGGAYSGDVALLVGLTPDGEVACGPGGGGASWLGLQVLRHAETPGLGSKMEDAAWRRQFCGHTTDDGDTFWAVHRDGGQVDQLTGATITSRAVTDALRGALGFFRDHREEILSGPPGRCEEAAP